MRIAVIVRSLKFGGMERAACNQADAFVQSGHDVDLIYFSNKNKTISPREKSVSIYHMDINKMMKKNFIGFIWNLFSKIMNIFFRGTYPLFKGYYTSSVFKKELEKLDSLNPYDIILVRGQGTFEQIWRYQDDRIIKICVNVSATNKSTLKDKIISKAYFNDSNVNCIADGTKEFYRNKFTRENVSPKTLISIKNPFFQHEILELSREKNPLLPSDKYILGLGRLVKAKNFSLLIDSYYILKIKYNINYKLVLVGEGSEKKSLMEQTKKLDLENDVIFTGYQKNPYTWMYNSELIVLTSKFEGLCNVLVEAMCCRTRIIINECPGGMRELMLGNLENNIAKADAKSISKKMSEVINKDKSFYYKDYDNLLNSLNPISIANKWIDTYCEK